MRQLTPIIELADPFNYRKKRTKKIAYIVIHFTANNGDTAKNNADYFHNHANLKASAHYFVDEKSIYHSVPEKNCAWHCGGSHYVHPVCRNDNSIGIEMCSRKDANGEYYIKDQTINNVIPLVKNLMKKYKIDVDHVLRHYDVTGKNCPAPFVKDPKQWHNFRLALTK